MNLIILSGGSCTGKTMIAKMLKTNQKLLLTCDTPWRVVKKLLKENNYDFVIIDDPLNQRQSVIDLLTEQAKQIFYLYLSNEIIIDRVSEKDIRNMVKQEVINYFLEIKKRYDK